MIKETFEKAKVTSEVRAPIIEKNVAAPIVKQEGFIGEKPQVLKADANLRAAGAPVEERTLGGMIKDVLSDIKHTIIGDDAEKKQ